MPPCVWLVFGLFLAGFTPNRPSRGQGDSKGWGRINEVVLLMRMWVLEPSWGYHGLKGARGAPKPTGGHLPPAMALSWGEPEVPVNPPSLCIPSHLTPAGKYTKLYQEAAKSCRGDSDRQRGVKDKRHRGEGLPAAGRGGMGCGDSRCHCVVGGDRETVFPPCWGWGATRVLCSGRPAAPRSWGPAPQRWVWRRGRKPNSSASARRPGDKGRGHEGSRVAPQDPPRIPHQPGGALTSVGQSGGAGSRRLSFRSSSKWQMICAGFSVPIMRRNSCGHRTVSPWGSSQR